MHPVIPAPIQEPVERFLTLLEQWNATHALTALPPESRFEELIQDSCALLPFLSALPSGAKVIDFGTGMGIPSVPLAMANPELEIHGLDKSKKKIAFVRQVGMELGLSNLFPIAGRAEEIAPLDADLGTAKAVGSLALLTEWWLRHGKKGAPLLLLKGEGWKTEPCPVGWSLQPHAYTLPTRGERVILHLTQEPGP